MANIVTFFDRVKGDRVLWMIVIFLSLISILIVYSASGSMAYKLRGGDTEYYLLQQLVFLAAGWTLMWMAYKLNYKIYARYAPMILAIAIPLLTYTLLFGVEINDAKRWITIPLIDMTFQTSDFAELALIIFVARALAVNQDKIKDFKSAILPIIIPIILVCGLIAPANLSTAALLFITTFLMMFIGRISLKFVFLLLLAGIIGGFLLVILSSQFPELGRMGTWVSRVEEFLLLSDGDYQVQQAKIAIAEGGFFGVGPGNSIQRHHLPYAYADCIYAIICEEYGIVGGMFVLLLYLALLYRCVSIVIKSPKAFGPILAMGLCLSLVVRAFANIAVSVQLVPATGLTLPMISMGGTSLMFTCISFGIILSVSRHAEKAAAEQKELNKIELAHESDH